MVLEVIDIINGEFVIEVVLAELLDIYNSVWYIFKTLDLRALPSGFDWIAS